MIYRIVYDSVFTLGVYLRFVEQELCAPEVLDHLETPDSDAFDNAEALLNELRPSF